MKIKTVAAALAFAAISAAYVTAAAQTDFVCMRSGETVAITNDENGNLKYTELRDSKGAEVAPQISSDGNTYLPFRYICDITGIADGNLAQGELPENSYRFINDSYYNNGGGSKIEIKYNGAYYCHNIGEEFEYTAADGSVRNVAIYNIRGTLYAPMGYLASLTGAYAAWDGSLSRIMFVRAGVNEREFLNENNALRRDKQMCLGYDTFGNNLVDSPLYLKTDGMTIADLSEELPDKSQARSVSRSGADIFYIDAADRFKVMNEGTKEIKAVSFRDESGAAVDIYCASAFVLKNKIYGIEADTPGEREGRLFSCDTDGGNFRYLTDNKVYNLIMKNTMLDYYLFYCDARTRSDLHMIKVNTMDDYELQITNFAHENMLSGIRQFVVGSRNIYYLDEFGSVHVIDLEYPLEQVSIARLKYGNTVYAVGTDGLALNNITSMNYDYINDILYIVQKDDASRIYYYAPQTGGFTGVGQMDEDAGGLALFVDSAYANHIAAALPDGICRAQVNYSDGYVTAY